MPRPKRKLDAKMVFDLARLGLTQPEIAGVLKCSVDTLARRFQKQMEQGWAEMSASVKRKQYEVAVLKGNPTMLIFLGKQYCGQVDRHAIGGGKDGRGPIPIAHAVDVEAMIDRIIGNRDDAPGPTAGGVPAASTEL